MIKYTTLGNLIAPAKVIRCGKGSFPVLSMTMHDGIVLQSERFKKSLASIDQSDYKVVKRGQLVVGFPIDEGVLYVQKAADEGIMSPAYNVWDINTEKVDADFLELCLHSPQSMQYYKDNLRGTTARRRSIPTADLLALRIRLPDMQTQREVVAIMRKTEAVIAARQEQLISFEQLVKSRFIELFDNGNCPIKQVDELCSDIVDCPHTTPKYEGELKNPAIRTSEIKKGYITWDTMRYVSDDEYQERISRLKPLAGDIVYGREGTFGNAAVLPKGFNFCLGQRVMLLRPNYQLCTSGYLLHALISDDVYQQAVGKNNASTVAHVNVKDVKQFKVPLPPIELQNQFDAFVKQTDKSKLAVQKGLQELEILKKSLMQQYFG